MNTNHKTTQTAKAKKQIRNQAGSASAMLIVTLLPLALFVVGLVTTNPLQYCSAAQSQHQSARMQQAGLELE
jgi:hypothetical protein